MPTLLRFDGMRVVLYPNDHRPAHVHVLGAGGEAVFALNCPDGPPTLRESYRLGRAEVGRIGAVLADNLAVLCAAWSRMHGRY